MQLWKLAATVAAGTFAAGVGAQTVRFDITLSGMSAWLAGGSSEEIPGFSGTPASAYVIADIGNGHVTGGPTWLAVRSEVGCPIYQDGVCSWSYGDRPPVITDWSFTSVLGTVARRPGMHSSAGITQEHQELNPYTQAPSWTGSIFDVQTEQRLSSNGHTLLVSNGFSGNVQSDSTPAFGAPLNLLQAWQIGLGTWAAINVLNQDASWDTEYANFASTGYSQTFYITGMTATVLTVPEPAADVLFGMGLVAVVVAARRRSRSQAA